MDEDQKQRQRELHEIISNDYWADWLVDRGKIERAIQYAIASDRLEVAMALWECFHDYIMESEDARWLLWTTVPKGLPSANRLPDGDFTWVNLIDMAVDDDEAQAEALAEE